MRKKIPGILSAFMTCTLIIGTVTTQKSSIAADLDTYFSDDNASYYILLLNDDSNDLSDETYEDDSEDNNDEDNNDNYSPSPSPTVVPPDTTVPNPTTTQPQAEQTPAATTTTAPTQDTNPFPEYADPNEDYFEIDITSTFKSSTAKKYYCRGGRAYAKKYTPSLSISWNEFDEAAYYEIYKSTSMDEEPEYVDETDESEYIDTEVVPGKTYYYTIHAFLTDEDEEDGDGLEYELISHVAEAEASTSAIKPAVKISYKKYKGTKYALINYNKYTGDSQEIQVKNGKKWKFYKPLSGKISSRTLCFKPSAVTKEIRISTYYKVGGKKKYSAWSNTLKIKQ